MRRLLFSLCLLLAITLPCRAGDDKPKPNTLTPKEIADGWILLFDGESSFGWTGDKWKVEKGELVSLGKNSPLRSTCEFLDFELAFECKSEGKGEAVLGFGKYSERDSHPVRISLRGNHPGWQKVRLTAEGKDVGGIVVSLASNKDPIFPEAVIRTRRDLTVPLVFTGESLRLRNLKLRPRGAKAIFNGKDLDGWKVFPDKKSKFTVTDKGELNVKDGPGDLQTTRKYRDFILQLECISLGKHLNSGIFFRCRDNEYQNGYEAQIHNRFTPEPAKEYVLEEYDPKTNELLAKKTIKSAAVDYGTGGIYRRVPARKQMANDNEWFAMTIIAHGNHLATWVNGIQVADWHDHRPPNDNPRKRQTLAAGHISIQGHDTTTNLSFRNLRVVELPAGK